MKLVSVVIPAYNEEKNIASTLESLVRQETSIPYEVILVNNNSTDDTVKIAETFKKRLTLRIISETKKGAGPARARGFEEVKGDIIFSTDADTRVPSLWIERFTHALTTRNIIAVTSPCDIDDPSWWNRTLFHILQRASNEGYRMLYRTYWLSGFSFALTKETYKKVGGLNTDLPSLDDIDLGQRLARLGKIVCFNDMAVISSHRRYRKGVVRGILSYVKPFLQMTYQKKSVSMTAER